MAMFTPKALRKLDTLLEDGRLTFARYPQLGRVQVRGQTDTMGNSLIAKFHRDLRELATQALRAGYASDVAQRFQAAYDWDVPDVVLLSGKLTGRTLEWRRFLSAAANDAGVTPPSN